MNIKATANRIRKLKTLSKVMLVMCDGLEAVLHGRIPMRFVMSSFGLVLKNGDCIGCAATASLIVSAVPSSKKKIVQKDEIIDCVNWIEENASVDNEDHETITRFEQIVDAIRNRSNCADFYGRRFFSIIESPIDHDTAIVELMKIPLPRITSGIDSIDSGSSEVNDEVIAMYRKAAKKLRTLGY